MISLAIADDHAPSLNRIVGFFKEKREYKVLTVADSGSSLLNLLNALKNPPQVIIVDVNMPVIDGVALAFYLKIHHPSIKTIALSAYDNKDMITLFLKSGGSGYINKFDFETVIDTALTDVMNDEIYVDTRIAKTSVLLINPGSLKTESATIAKKFGLTPREFTFVILNATALNFEEIARIMYVELKTIQTYFDRVSKKLNVNNRHALAIFSLQHGLAKIACYNS